VDAPKAWDFHLGVDEKMSCFASAQKKGTLRSTEKEQHLKNKSAFVEPAISLEKERSPLLSGGAKQSGRSQGMLGFSGVAAKDEVSAHLIQKRIVAILSEPQTRGEKEKI